MQPSMYNWTKFVGAFENVTRVWVFSDPQCMIFTTHSLNNSTTIANYTDTDINLRGSFGNGGTSPYEPLRCES